MKTKTSLGREVTLEQAADDRLRVEIRWVEGYGYASGPTMRTYIGRNSEAAKARIFLLLRRRDSSGGYQIDQSEIASMREVIR